MCSYWSEMAISDNHEGLIISKDPPPPYNDDKKIIISYNLSEGEYEEVVSFVRVHNQMSTGNTTLLSKEDLVKYLSLDTTVVLMRSQNNNKLIGFVMSIKLPILNNNKELVDHGCTTFMVIHSSLRGFGMCMGLIRALTQLGYERGIYCDYHTIPMKLGSNSIKLNSWYRPLNLTNSVNLGFLYPNYDNPRNVRRNRLKYNTNLPPNITYKKINSGYLEFYRMLVVAKRFVFYPENDLWERWISLFDTYIISHEGNEVGLVSLNKIECIVKTTNMEGKIVTPVICLGQIDIVLSSLFHISKNLGYDVIYFHEYGDIKREHMERFNCVPTNADVWFGLYNNAIELSPNDISVPLF